MSIFGSGSDRILTLNYQQIFVVGDEIQSKLLMSWYQNFQKLVDCLIDSFPFSLDVVLLSRNGLRIMAMKGMEEDLAAGIFEFLLKNGLILGYQKNCHTISGGDRF